jgi:hypothetical protein
MHRFNRGYNIHSIWYCGHIIAVGTFWVTRHTTRRPIGKSHFAKRTLFSENIELINFSNRYCTRFRVRSSTAAPEIDSNAIAPPTMAHEPATDRHQLYKVIGNALDVFSRHLRASHLVISADDGCLSFRSRHMLNKVVETNKREQERYIV